MASIAELLAARSQRMEAEAFLTLIFRYDPWRGYDPVRDVELLAEWLGPFKQSSSASYPPIPSIAHNWQMLALSRCSGASIEQIYSSLKNFP